MNRMPVIFLGIFATFAFAWGGLVVAPYFQIGRLEPFQNDEGQVLPPPLSGLSEEGRRVYASAGCIYCHSQQVRGADQGSDLARGWGARRSVPRDYIREKPVFLGTMRSGPDLSNIGARQTSALWHHQHLYNPQALSPGSTMAPYRYLYTVQKIVGQPHPRGFRLPAPYDTLPPDFEIVPTYEAEALVAYLLSLNRNYALPEAPTE
jgi:cytochrome c oxidase cbb3-type subunit 2